ncbi:hypothetical protein HUT18_32625 [Streptomyces sp. NA04227]|uniref:hypothetical protein n=1 Tax=Streptomyces sp. NA04227 TaxID=2742136 RepID=UPI00159206D3|nr:hypothetical protein [Streptomyces sp. NA04227]QKW10459.1 hypothetical protein HUT18_32625 [Streptomyces sp. NA04227]
MSSTTPLPAQPSPSATNRAVRGAARVLAAAGLAVNTYFHVHLADNYDVVEATVSQGTLFRLEAALTALAALLVLVWRRWPGDAFAWLVSAGGLALLLVYRYVDVGELGPLPNMYEPLWFDDKKWTVASQAVTILATTVLLLTGRHRHQHERRHGKHAQRPSR